MHVSMFRRRGGGTGKGAVFEFFWQFLGQIPDPWDWKIVQI